MGIGLDVTKAQAAFVLGKEAQTIAGNKEGYLDGFSKNCDARTSFSVNGGKEEKGDYTKNQLEINEKRPFSPVDKVHKLSMQITFSNGQPEVKSEMLATLKNGDTPIVLLSRQTTNWLLESSDNDGRGYSAAAMDVNLVDFVGKAKGEDPDATVKISTRFWNRNVKVESPVVEQDLSQSGLNPQDVVTVLQYWSGYWTGQTKDFEKDQLKAENVFNKQAFVETFANDDRKFAVDPKHIKEIEKIALEIFEDKNGNLMVSFERAFTTKRQSIVENGHQRWFVVDREKKKHVDFASVVAEANQERNKAREDLRAIVKQTTEKRAAKKPEENEKNAALLEKYRGYQLAKQGLNKEVFKKAAEVAALFTDDNRNECHQKGEEVALKQEPWWKKEILAKKAAEDEENAVKEMGYGAQFLYWASGGTFFKPVSGVEPSNAAGGAVAALPQSKKEDEIEVKNEELEAVVNA